jgi:mannose-6-phosphate isomerase-like protein (cupin superfamily)
MIYLKGTTLVLLFLTIAALSYAKVMAETNSAGSADRVIYFNSAEVSAAFKKGTSSLIKFSNYKVLACHREVPGIPEVHIKDTDVFYVLEGSASLVAGGTVVGGHPTTPDEIRGKKITGGKAYKLNKGDVIIIPRNTPHWFKEVPGPFYYFAVKITS